MFSVRDISAMAQNPIFGYHIIDIEKKEGGIWDIGYSNKILAKMIFRQHAASIYGFVRLFVCMCVQKN